MENIGNNAWIVSAISLGANILSWVIIYAVFMSRQQEKITNNTKAISAIEQAITAIESNSERISKLEGVLEARQMIKKQSPWVLTEAGQKLLLESGAEDYLQNNKDNLFQHFEDSIETKFDIQNEAREIITAEIGKKNIDALKQIKNYAYEQGKGYEDLIDVMSVMLRDMFISEVFEKGTTSNV